MATAFVCMLPVALLVLYCISAVNGEQDIPSSDSWKSASKRGWIPDVSIIASKADQKVDSVLAVKVSPSSSEEIRLTAAIAIQANIVSEASKMLRTLEAKINATLDAQADLCFEYEIAKRVSLAVVTRYQEEEARCNQAEVVYIESAFAVSELQPTLSKAKDNATAAADALAGNISLVRDGYLEFVTLNATAQKAKEAFVAADNDTTHKITVLLETSDALQAAIDELNRRNNELLDVEKDLANSASKPSSTYLGSEDQLPDTERELSDTTKILIDKQRNLTEHVHNQSLVVANLTKLVSLQEELTNAALKNREQAAKHLAESEDALAGFVAFAPDILELKQTQNATAEAFQNATIIYDMAEEKRKSRQTLSDTCVTQLMLLREPVQNATDKELQTKVECAKTNVTYDAFQEVLRRETDHLQEEMLKLNALNHELKEVQEKLERGAAMHMVPALGVVELFAMLLVSLSMM